MDFKKLLKDLAVAYAKECPEDVVELVQGWALAKLEKSTPEELVDAIEHGTPLWPNVPDGDKNAVMKALTENPELYDQYREYLTFDNLVQWIREDIPHLGTVFDNWPTLPGQVNKAYDWLYRNYAEVFGRFDPHGAPQNR